MSTKIQGTVKFFNEEKGFGFIKQDHDGKDTFVHKSGLIDQIKQDDRVEFELEQGKKGPNAIKVQRIQ